MWLKNDGLDLLDIGGIKGSSDRGYFIENKHQIVDKPDRRVAESSLPPFLTAIMSQLLPVQRGEGRGDTSQGVVYMSLYTLLFAYENEEFSLSKGWLTSPPSWVLCHANIHIFPSSSEPWSSSILIKSSSPTSNLGDPFCRPTLPRAAFALFRVEPGLNKLQSVRYINYHLHQETYQTLGKRFSMTD